MPRRIPCPHRERGVVLAISLVFLLLLTIIGMTAMGTGTLQEKMAGNMRDLDISLQAAESSLRFGEGFVGQAWAANGSKEPDVLRAVNGIWFADEVDWEDLSGWWVPNSRLYQDDGTKQITEAAEDPRQAVERVGEGGDDDTLGGEYGKPKTVYYRITARGVGMTTTSQSVLQSYYPAR